MTFFVGTDGADNFTGTNSDDVIRGARGDDTLNGVGGNDVFIYRPNEAVSSSDGNDVIDGSFGLDLLSVEGDRNRAYRDLNQDLTIDFPTYSLMAGAGGTVVFAMEQTVTQGAAVSTARATVTAVDVETFSYLGRTGPIDPGPFVNGPGNEFITTYSGDDHLTIGDLSGTDMTGLIEFDGSTGDDFVDRRPSPLHPARRRR